MIVAAGVIFLVATKLEYVMRWCERMLLYAATATIILAMLWVTAEVCMRKFFNSPLPGHLEGAELLVPIIVFFGISFAQSRGDHVGMTLIVDAMAPKARHYSTIVTLLLSMFTCAILAYFSAKYSFRLWDYDDVTMSPPYWPTWPSGAAITLGYGLVALRMYLQVLQMLFPDRLPEPEADDSELHAASD
jgi:TRAP-type C4-dicarboxylate transport system permease small subunit